MKILDNEGASSVTFGIILTVAIGVIVSAMGALFYFELSETNVKGPKASILVMDYPETTGINDIKIVHVSGDTIEPGDWKLSIVKAGDRPVFRVVDTSFSAGDQILTTNLTDGDATYIISKRGIFAEGKAEMMKRGNKYNVQVMIFPFKTITVDTDVVVH